MTPCDSPASGAFVGRDAQLQLLARELDAVRGGRGRLVTLAGDAGIGKTRLAEELVAHADLPPAHALWGRCTEQAGAPAFWPWIQVVRGWAERRDDAALAAVVGPSAPEIAALLPALRARLAAADAAAALDSEEWRFRLFDALASFLRRATARETLLVVLDDLHWADPASLELLAFLTRELRDMRLLLLGTYRDVEMYRRPMLLDGITRASQRIRLRGLDRADVDTLVRATTGVVPPTALVDDVHRITEGNPFFLGELLRMLAGEGGLAAPAVGKKLPVELRATIRRRLEPLADGERAVLGLAAVAGREFDVGLLQAASDLPHAELLERLGPACDAGLVAETAETPGRFRFAHALIRETLYDDLAPSERGRAHQRIGRALEAATAGHGDPPLAELAYHFGNAAPLGDVATAVDYAERAGQQARATLAFEDAVAHFESALRLSAQRPADEPRRLRLELGLAAVALRASDSGRARTRYANAAKIAERLGDAAAIAEAALGYQAARTPTGVVDPVEVRLLEQALQALGDADSAVRPPLLVGLARALLYADGPDRAPALVGEALAVARRVGDPAALALALASRNFMLMGPHDVGERLALIDEAIAIAERGGATAIAFSSRVSRVHDLLEAGRVPAAIREIDVLSDLAERSHMPVRRWIVATLRASVALSSGRAEEGALRAAQALQLPRDGQDPAVLMTYCGQMFVARRELCQLDAQLEASIATFADAFPGMHSWRASMALVHAEAGRTVEARELVDRMSANDFAVVRRDMHFLPSLALLAETVHTLREPAHAPRLYALLRPLAGRNIVASWWSPSYVGSAERYLGLLAETAGQVDDAAAHYHRAIAENDRLGVRGQAGHARVDYARLLLERDASGDGELAFGLVAEAREIVEALGLPRLRERLAAFGPEARLPAPAPAAAQRACFRRVDDEWEIGIAPKTFRLKDARGLAYLVRLLAAPEQEVHALDLATGADDAVVDAGDAGEMLDPSARSAYRHRLADLERELDEATRFNDPGRVERATAEMEFLRAELARAVGLGGRSRRAGASAERARLSVTRALGRAIEKIAAEDAVLGQHLAAAVRRGTFCCYAPDPRLPIHWEL